MDTQRIFPFLRDIAQHNNREWFSANKDRYICAMNEFTAFVADAIGRIGSFDPSILSLEPKDCIYRFYRDIRFSPDKSPYKRHFGAYICLKGKSSPFAGYYIHLQPGNSFIAAGAYCLPNNVLNACRNEIMANIDEWRRIVENKQFVNFFGSAQESHTIDSYEHNISDKGFGSTAFLKKAPKDFPSDYPFLIYLKMKDYSCWHKVDDHFFEENKWIRPTTRMLKTAKPMLDFINSVIKDYV